MALAISTYQSTFTRNGKEEKTNLDSLNRPSEVKNSRSLEMCSTYVGRIREYSYHVFTRRWIIGII